ncbi:hypothetical protein MBLNU457_3146t1 [Dothideomycetes sp. NU457]
MSALRRGLDSRESTVMDSEIADLKQDARFVFYHGLTNYHRYAYPEDELRPLSCGPLTRDRSNPAHIEVNDVLGNYTLSIVDSLSTLAILASSPTSKHDDHNALHDFQKYVGLIVDLYGDGSEGEAGRGSRARGFDLDSKVQVFETTIRGVGGLLSAHLFAVGDLPIRGYNPEFVTINGKEDCIVWSFGGKDFIYDGQLLRLAHDLARRMLPAFHTPTGLPYPRVNLRHGTPFYENSPLNNDAEHGQCQTTQVPKTEREVTETCSAGAGSLVLEFTTLSRLIGDPTYEKLAKRAFWAVWERRTGSGLIGAGIDAETGQWVSPYTGIGAGIDSFFEYSLKSHVLLSALDGDEDQIGEDSPLAFLQTWQDAHAAISRHIYRDARSQHPHYAQNDMWTGGPRLGWIDSLSAYYPGLLTLAGEVEEAAVTHLLYTALWTRYGALPERWNTFTGKIDAGLRWWGGRPEFIESTWYLYRATQDPWYLHVGEMALRDIKRRCFTPCGWAGLQDVRTGEQTDRMESFFLGETAKYLYLLFDDDHPLNKLDTSFVFTTEGHPLLIPRRIRQSNATKSKGKQPLVQVPPALAQAVCPVAPRPEPFSISPTAARADLFHAAALARLHLMPTSNSTGSPLMDHAFDHPSISAADVQSPTNYTFYPWTLPQGLIPHNGMCKKMATRHTFDLTFPALPNTPMDFGALQRVDGGILVNSISGLRFGLLLDRDPLHKSEHVYRIYALANLALGRDESIWLGRDVVSQVDPADPHLSRVKDIDSVDLLIDAPVPLASSDHNTADDVDFDSMTARLSSLLNGASSTFDLTTTFDADTSEQLLAALPKVLMTDSEQLATQLESLADLNLPTLNLDGVRSIAKALRANAATKASTTLPQMQRFTIPAMLPTGPGAAALPASVDTNLDISSLAHGQLPFSSIFVLDSDLCTTRLPAWIVKKHNVLVIRRGGCSFSSKLENIPSYAPGGTALQVVIVVSADEQDGDGVGIRPLLDKPQLTPSGVARRNPVPLLMVSGGEETWSVFARAAGRVARFDGADITDDEELTKGKGSSGGLGIKRRYWFASQGIRIMNLFAH